MKYTLTATLILLTGSLAIAQDESFPILFTNVHVFDGVNEERIENANVLVVDNLIAEVSAEPIAAANARVIDGGGRTLMPGLIDAHVHFATDPTKERRDNAEKVLKEMLLTGITSVRDMAGDARALASLSRNTLVGDVDGPTIYYSAIMAGTRFFSDPRTIATAQGGVSGEMPYMKAIHSRSNLPLENILIKAAPK